MTEGYKGPIVFINHKNLAEWKDIEKVMYVESDLLSEGTYVGLDGIKTYYPGMVLEAANDSIIGKPIKISHVDSSESVIGFWTRVQGNGKTRVGGHVFSPEGIDFLKEHPNYGLSMEADAETIWDEKRKEEVSQSLYYTAGSVVENPAFGDRIDLQREIRLQRPFRKEKEMKEGEKENFIEFKENANATREAFFTWLKKQLEEAKVEDVDKIMTAITGSVKSALPYPAPKVKAQADPIKISADALGIKEEDRAEYTKFMKACDEGTKVCAAKWMAAHPVKKQEEPKDKIVATLKLQLENAQAAIDERLTEDNTALMGEILKHDKDFKFDDLFGKQEDLLARKKQLARYLEVLKRVAPSKPISLKLSGSVETEAKRKELAASMFGDASLLKHITGGNA